MAADSRPSQQIDHPCAATDPGRGRRIGVDVGSVRIGVACSDPDGLLATPVETVVRDRTGESGSAARDVGRIAQIVLDYAAVEIVVGFPQTMAGEKGNAARLALEFADRLREVVGSVPVRLADERLTTVRAARALRDSGVRARGQRPVIDQAAAVTILQGWLDERNTVLRRVAPTPLAAETLSAETERGHAGEHGGRRSRRIRRR